MSETTPDATLATRHEYRSTRLTLIVYRNELARTLPSERETAGKSTAMIWSSPRVQMPLGVKSGQSLLQSLIHIIILP